MKFPEIDYSFWLKQWNETVGKFKVYSNKHMEQFIVFDGDINQCTDEIVKLTQEPCPNKEIILRALDLIYSWGGRSGRMFYFKSKNGLSPREEIQNNNEVFGIYKKGIELAKEGLPESIEIFNRINGIGSSYASKHSYFWSLHSKSPLIIVDSKIAGALGYNSIKALEKHSTYSNTVKEFIKKAEIEFDCPNPNTIERALFAFHNHYFLNNNSNWKNNSQFNDYDEAKRLSKVLF